MRATFQEIRLPSPDRSKEKYVSKRSCILCQLPCQFLVPTIPRRQKQPVVGILLYTQFKSFEKYVNRSSFLSKFSAKGLQRQNKYFFSQVVFKLFHRKCRTATMDILSRSERACREPKLGFGKKKSTINVFLLYSVLSCKL